MYMEQNTQRANVFGNRPAAVLGHGLDAGVPAHFGDPAGEQAALLAGRAVTDLSHLDVVTVTGADSLSYLTTLSTQVVTDLQAGDSAEALLLDPQGRITFWLGVTDDGQQTFLITEAGRGEDLVGFLEKMKFMLRVEAKLSTDDYAVLGVMSQTEGEDALNEIESGLEAVTVWRDAWPQINPNGTSYCAVEADKHPARQHRRHLLVVPRGTSTQTAQQLLDGLEKLGPVTLPGGWTIDSARPAGTLAWEALRIADWRPRWGNDVDHKTLPHELDWLRTAVHLHKGCYCGQEAVARLINLGKPPRRLVQLDLDGSEGLVPRPGDRVMVGARAVGTVTSVATHFEDGPIALATLRRATAEGPVEVEVTEEAETDEGTETEATATGASEKVENQAPASRVVGKISAGVRPVVRPDGRCDHTPEQRPGQELRGFKLGQ